MTADTWAIIGTAIVVLLAIATSNRSIRRELSEIRLELRRQSERIAQVEVSLNERIGQVEASFN